MNRSSEDTHSRPSDHLQPGSKDAGQAPGSADSNRPNELSFPSIERICDELRKINTGGLSSGLHVEPIAGSPHRRDHSSRKHFHVLDGSRIICRLTVARDLAQLWERSQAFAHACPEIACRPLFNHRIGEWDCLGIEFFDGPNLDDLLLEQSLTPAEAAKHGGKIITALERTLQPSTVEAAAQEIDALFRQVCLLPIFDKFDQSFLQQAVFPLVRAGALTGPFHTRWTNGDLIPRNILVDSQGSLRLVDYEFAGRTHFFVEDGWRWRAFSNLPPEMRDLPVSGGASSKDPWAEIFFLLKHLVLTNAIGSAQLTATDSRPIIDWLVAASARTLSQSCSGVFLQPLATSFTLQHTDQAAAKALALGRVVTSDALREIGRLRSLLYQREEKVRIMQSSFSWKATAPLRALRRKFIDPHRPQQIVAPDSAHLPAINFHHSPHDFDGTAIATHHNIDQPSSWDALTGPVEVRGWCFTLDKVPLRAVRARVGDRIFSGIYGQSRPDIAGQYSQFPQAERCGFKIDLILDLKDTHIVIEVGDGHGNWHRVLTRHRGQDQGSAANDYARWISLYDTLTPKAIGRIRANLRNLKHQPLISVLMPVYNTPEKWLARAIESVREQVYDHWELCIADDASTMPHVRPLLEKAAREDARIKVVFREKNGHISAASNSALELACGDFVALLDHDDELRPHALACVAFELDRFPDADLVYSDEDKLSETGNRYDPYFKPDWNPDLFLVQNFICHLGVYRTALIREVGGFRTSYEGSQDWDLAMRVAEHSSPLRIRHIPRILYHWRALQGSTATQVNEKHYSVTAAEKTIADHFVRAGIKATVTPTDGHYWRVHYPRPDPAPRITLIIPTRNHANLLRTCITSILQKTAYPNYEILVVDNDSDEPEAVAYLHELRRHPRCHVIAFPGSFNFSAINNFAVRQTDAPIIGLLNNDLEVINGNWLDEMASHVFRPEIGCVGAKLYYLDDRIQHAGVILGIGGVAGHAFKYLPRHEPGIQHRPHLVQNVSAVTAACLVIRKSLYFEAGGFDENIAIAFNDVDFCLKVQSLGYRNLYTPFAELIHHESVSRGYEDNPEKLARFSKEVEYMKNRWGDLLLNDPAYNPNLSLEHEDFSPAFPPRIHPFAQSTPA